MPCQFGIETVIVYRDTGKLKKISQILENIFFNFTISFRISGAPLTVMRWVWPDACEGTKQLMTAILFREEEKWKRWIIFRDTRRPFLGVTASPEGKERERMEGERGWRGEEGRGEGEKERCKREEKDRWQEGRGRDGEGEKTVGRERGQERRVTILTF